MDQRRFLPRPRREPAELAIKRSKSSNRKRPATRPPFWRQTRPDGQTGDEGRRCGKTEPRENRGDQGAAEVAGGRPLVDLASGAELWHTADRTGLRHHRRTGPARNIGGCAATPFAQWARPNGTTPPIAACPTPRPWPTRLGVFEARARFQGGRAASVLRGVAGREVAGGRGSGGGGKQIYLDLVDDQLAGPVEIGPGGAMERRRPAGGALFRRAKRDAGPCPYRSAAKPLRPAAAVHQRPRRRLAR